MKTIWLQTNLVTWAVSQLSLEILSLFELTEPDGLHAHGAETRNQESGREPLAIYFAVYLVGRLKDVQVFQHPRKLFVADAAPHHLLLYQDFRLFVPSPIWLRRLPDTLMRHFCHRSPRLRLRPRPSDVEILSRLISVVYDRNLIVGSTRSNQAIFEDRVLTKSLQSDLLTRRATVARRTATRTRSWLQTPEGDAK